VPVDTQLYSVIAFKRGSLRAILDARKLTTTMQVVMSVSTELDVGMR
jgi:hypothetical protein